MFLSVTQRCVNVDGIIWQTGGQLVRWQDLYLWVTKQDSPVTKQDSPVSKHNSPVSKHNSPVSKQNSPDLTIGSAEVVTLRVKIKK